MKILATFSIFFLLLACDSKVKESLTPEELKIAESPSASSQTEVQAPSPCDGVCKMCKLPNGEQVFSGVKLRLFKKSNSGCTATCQSISTEATCQDGKIIGADPNIYSFTSCDAPVDCKPCTLPCGGQIMGGTSGECFKTNQVTACGDTCLPVRKKFLCNNGVLTGEDGAPPGDSSAFKFRTCSETAVCKTCKLADGREVNDGERVPFFKQRYLACGQSCTATTNHILLTCSNGRIASRELYPDFNFLSCMTECTGDKGAGRIEGDGGGAPNSVCPLPWGSGYATHNTEVLAFDRPISCTDSCNNHKKIIKCNGYRGLWTGGATFIYPTCDEKCK